jgi:hypothetical protein
MSATLIQRGFSDAANFLEREVAEGRRWLHESSVLGIQHVRDELAAVWEACRHPDWDGYDARPVTQEVLRNTYVLLESLPLGFPPPSIGAEPDGDLTLEWHCSPVRTLSVSVTAHGELYWAALLGSSRAHGSEPFFGDCPPSILDMIRRVYQP